MNFEEWYKYGTPEEQPCFMSDAEMGWEACKNEVLEILNKYKTSEYIGGVEFPTIDIRAIEEINEL